MNPNEIPTPSLKPCPFCGGTAIKFDKDTTAYMEHAAHIGYCLHCGAVGPNRNNEQDAFNEWNTRDERELHLANQQVEELKKAVAEHDICLERCSKCGQLYSPSLIESGECIFCTVKDKDQQITKLEAACAQKDEALKVAMANFILHNEGMKMGDLNAIIDFLNKAHNSSTSGQRILEEIQNKEEALAMAKFYWNEGECYCLSKNEGGSSEPCFHCQLGIALKKTGWSGSKPQALNPTNQPVKEEE